MIENELREAFARQEQDVPDASRLVPAIDAAARRRRGRRTLLRSGAAAIAVALVVAVPTVGRAWLTTMPAPTPSAGHTAPDYAGRALNFLVAGVDRLPSWSADTLTRTDAIILAHVPADRSAVYLITIPRDLEVAIPAYPEANFMGMRTKINAAYAFGGFALLATRSRT